jgi:FKBP-type peptidyl-prolyl cis-trans isomerase
MHSSLLLRASPLLVVTLVAACTPRGRSVTTSSGLRYEMLATGEGPVSQSGQEVSIHETTSLVNGAVLYSSRGGGPITFRLGGNQVIAGVEEGVTGMRVGERRRLVVPPALSRRASYPPNTPPDSTLHIDVELVQIRCAQSQVPAAIR